MNVSNMMLLKRKKQSTLSCETRERVLCFEKKMWEYYETLICSKAALAPFRLAGQQQQAMYANGCVIILCGAKLHGWNNKYQAKRCFCTLFLNTPFLKGFKVRFKYFRAPSPNT
jgi:hypothetical protein